MRTNIKVLALLATTAVSTALATEWRTPWISERGPIRHTFEKLHNDRKEWNSSFWTSASMKEAHKAFMKHSFKTQPLTALMFNQADFKLSGIFSGSEMAANSEFYNPFMNITTFQPRATYMEYGLNLGGRIDYPVYGRSGRVGLRATVPFRYIQIQRNDTSDKLTDPLDGVRQTTFVNVTKKEDGNPGSATDVPADAWRLDFIKALKFADGGSLLTTDGTNVAIGGTNVDHDTTAVQDQHSPSVALVKADANNALLYNAWQWDSTNDVFVQGNGIATVGTTAATNLAGAPGDLATLDTTKLNVLATNTDYQAVINGLPGTIPDDIWLIGRYATNETTPSKRTQESNAIFDKIEYYAHHYNDSIFEFMARKNFVFETQDRSGIGDCDADLFYEHMFSKAVMGELCLGIKLPTGGSKDQGLTNPYRPQLGNGGHWEVKLGGALAWQPISWMNTKLDVYYSLALEATEHRVATFAGSTIKNIGPRADADVDWGYFVGRLDCNFFHPKTDTIRGTLGYEFYYKTEDNVHFKQKTMAGWEGRTNDGTTFVANLLTLDDKRARAHTESIAHKARFEMSFQVMKYFELFMGGSSTFAGQNVYRDRDAHGGCNVRF